MPLPLARLRSDLDVLASPIPDRPGLLVRDPFRYSDSVVVIPPTLARCLACFDGSHTIIDLQQFLGRLADVPNLGAAAADFARGLSMAGFLDDEVFRDLKNSRLEEFVRSPVRLAAFAGGGYPADKQLLTETVAGWIADGKENAPAAPTVFDDSSISPAVSSPIVAIAAPHVSPSGGISAYGAAYRALAQTPTAFADRTFVILGTSHYGRPNRFGLTRKSFRTPFGEATTDGGLVDRLVADAPGAFDVEDYCHAVEHSIEFQVLFLQSLFGPAVRILPILCGPFFGGSFHSAGSAGPRPEDDAGVAKGLEALARLRAHRHDRLLWVLGVDLAHVGRRYGDSIQARAHDGAMNQVAARDRERLDRIANGDAGGFWDLTHEGGTDDLKWCGSSPLYTFLRTHPEVRGQVLHYDQWNIDDASVVSFAALSFSEP